MAITLRESMRGGLSCPTAGRRCNAWCWSFTGHKSTISDTTV
jgi:hypothetical protein